MLPCSPQFSSTWHSSPQLLPSLQPLGLHSCSKPWWDCRWPRSRRHRCNQQPRTCAPAKGRARARPSWWPACCQHWYVLPTSDLSNPNLTPCSRRVVNPTHAIAILNSALQIVRLLGAATTIALILTSSSTCLPLSPLCALHNTAQFGITATCSHFCALADLAVSLHHEPYSFLFRFSLRYLLPNWSATTHVALTTGQCCLGLPICLAFHQGSWRGMRSWRTTLPASSFHVHECVSSLPHRAAFEFSGLLVCAHHIVTAQKARNACNVLISELYVWNLSFSVKRILGLFNSGMARGWSTTAGVSWGCPGCTSKPWAPKAHCLLHWDGGRALDWYPSDTVLISGVLCRLLSRFVRRCQASTRALARLVFLALGGASFSCDQARICRTAED